MMNDLYYGYSLFFLIVRTVTMFLCAARIHEAAKKPLDIVSKIPNTGWCVEVSDRVGEFDLIFRANCDMIERLVTRRYCISLICELTF